MQTFWRSFHGIKSHINSSKIMHFRSSEVFQQSTGYSKDSMHALPFKCRAWYSVIVENKLHSCRELTPSNNGILRCGIIGINPPFKCMTTVGRPEPSLEQGTSAASLDIVQPQRIKFKRPDKTAKHIMNILDKEAVEKVQADREIPDEVPENKRRVSILKGIVIARRNAGLNTTFRLRRLVAGVGVESVFPLYSPNIKEMKILDKKKVRRAKLYYLRDRMNALKK